LAQYWFFLGLVSNLVADEVKKTAPEDGVHQNRVGGCARLGAKGGVRRDQSVVVD